MNGHRVCRDVNGCLLAACLSLVAPHAAYGVYVRAPTGIPYAAEVQPDSTTFNAGATFNANFRFGGGEYYGRDPGGYVETFRVAYQADPGWIFTDVGARLGPWDNYGPYYILFEWLVPDAVYVAPDGTPSFFDHQEQGAGSWWEMAAWNTPDGGVKGYTAQQWNWGGGHAGEWLSIMPNGGRITIGDPSFLFELNQTISIYHDHPSNHWSFSTAEVHIAPMQLAPTQQPVPDPETYTMVLAGLGLLGFMVRRMKKQAA